MIHALDYKYLNNAFTIATNYVISTHDETIKIHFIILGIINYSRTE